MFDPKNDTILPESIKKYECLVNYAALFNLEDYPACPVLTPYEALTVFHIINLPASSTATFYTFTLNALASVDCTIGYIINASHQQLSLYIALKSSRAMARAVALLKEGLNAVFPAVAFEILSKSESMALMLKLFNPCSWGYVSSVSIIPNAFSILNSFTSLMQSQDYTALFLAEPISEGDTRDLISCLKELYNHLYPYRQSAQNFVRSTSKGSSTTHTDSTSCTNGDSLNKTNAASTGCTFNSYKTLTPSTPFSLLQNRTVNVSLALNSAQGSSQLNNNSIATGNSHSEASSSSSSNATNFSSSTSEAQNYSIQNKFALDAVTRLTILINRLEASISTPTFRFAGFFSSLYAHTTLQGAYNYAGLSTNLTSPLAPYYINNWSYFNPNYGPIITSLSNLNMPCFVEPCDNLMLSPGEIITSKELFNTLNFVYSQFSP